MLEIDDDIRCIKIKWYATSATRVTRSCTIKALVEKLRLSNLVALTCSVSTR
jgi:hypothetical protein